MYKYKCIDHNTVVNMWTCGHVNEEEKNRLRASTDQTFRSPRQLFVIDN